MTPVQKTLLLIFLFVAIAIGGFVYFVLNWGNDAAQVFSLLRSFA